MNINQDQIDLIKRLGDYYYTNTNDVGNVVREAFAELWAMPDNVWYKNVHHEKCIVYKTGGTSGYGTDGDGDWAESNNWTFDHPEDWVEATKSEINLALINVIKDNPKDYNITVILAKK